MQVSQVPSFNAYVINKINEKVNLFAGSEPVQPNPPAPIEQDPRVSQQLPEQPLMPNSVYLATFAQLSQSFEALPPDLQRLTLSTMDFQTWIAIRGRAKKAQTVKTIDRAVIEFNKIGNPLARAINMTSEEELLGFFFDRMLKKVQPEELQEIIRLDGADSYRPKVIALSSWEKVAKTVRAVTTHPLVVYPGAIAIGIVSYKVARNFLRMYNELLLPLALAAAETHLHPRVWGAVKVIYNQKVTIYLVGLLIGWSAPKFPLVIQPYVAKAGKVLELPYNLAWDISWKILFLPYNAFLYGAQYTHSSARQIDKILGQSIDATSRMRIHDARQRWIQDLSNQRRAAAAAAA